MHYTLYNKKVEPEVVSQANILTTDSTQQAAEEDSAARAKAAADSLLAASSIAPGSYKFVLESPKTKRRALSRHLQVSDISPRIKLESNPDSTQFNIYVVLPAMPTDTTRIKDSLNAWYYGSRPLRVTIIQ